MCLLGCKISTTGSGMWTFGFQVAGAVLDPVEPLRHGVPLEEVELCSVSPEIYSLTLLPVPRSTEIWASSLMFLLPQLCRHASQSWYCQTTRQKTPFFLYMASCQVLGHTYEEVMQYPCKYISFCSTREDSLEFIFTDKFVVVVCLFL